MSQNRHVIVAVKLFVFLLLIGAWALLARVRSVLEWLAAYPLIPLEGLLVFAIVWGLLGKNYGLPSLFWHENPRTQVQGLARHFNEPDPTSAQPFFTTVVFESPAAAALSWYLTTHERGKIKKGMGEPTNARRLERLKEWWES